MRSAAAFIGEHTYSAKIATGRPDAKDLAIALDFGKKTVESISGNVYGELELKGNYPFAWQGFDPEVVPIGYPPRPRLVTGENCAGCKLCAQNCPWAAISLDDSKIRNYSKCMICYRRLKSCPSQAIQVTGDEFLSILPQFETMCSERREPELFLPFFMKKSAAQ